jgi:ankyrin repeat protein
MSVEKNKESARRFERSAMHIFPSVLSTLLLIACRTASPPEDDLTNLNEDLLEAAKEGDFDAAKTLLENGADANAKDKQGRTALMKAANMGYTGIVRVLLDAGADVNAKNQDLTTALMWAASEGHAAVVELLLDAGADVNAKADKGVTALMAAVAASSLDSHVSFLT